MNQPIENDVCHYQLGSANTHEFTFFAGNRNSIKAWADHIEQIQLQHKWYNTGHVKLLVDVRKVMNLPLRYLFEMLSDYNRPYPDLEPPQVTIAVVRSPDTVVLDIYQMMAELFEPPLTLQFFTDEAKARNWLSR